jgi:hypothetical protein
MASGEKRYRLDRKDKAQYIEAPRSKEGLAWLNWMRIHDSNFHTKIKKVIQEAPSLVAVYQIINK